jgi:hypothetical protein
MTNLTEDQKTELKNNLLHIIRNGNLLNLSSTIVISEFTQTENILIQEISKSYKNFALNLESEILKALNV